METQLINSNGITLAVQDYGPTDAVPLILVRGQGSQMAHWPTELVQGFVARGFRTVIFDNRDVGLSQRCADQCVSANSDDIVTLLKRGEQLPTSYAIDDMARDVTGFMDELGIEKAHLFGISMGGMIAQQIVLQSPERVLSAIIVMSACRPALKNGPATAEELTELVERLLVRPMNREEYLESQVEEHAKWGSPGYPMSEADIYSMGAVAFDRGVDAEGMNRQLLAAFHAPDRRPGLRKTQVPCFVIHGEDDALLPIVLGQEIADMIPDCDFLAVAGMGHMITPSLAPLIVEAVVEFLSLQER